MTLQYNYSQARAHCAQAGMTFIEALLPQTDAEFTRAHMTQTQVDIAMDLHIWALRYIFTPKNYSFWQRIGLALHFLFSRKTL